MAKPFSRSLEFQINNDTKNIIQGLIIFSVVLLVMIQNYFPSDNSNALTCNQCAVMHRFQVGDSLLFVYQPDNDLVIHVINVDYTKCKTTTPIVTYTDGNSVFTFNQSVPFQFISGVRENCLKNEKLIVVVMADRNDDHSSNSNTTSPPTGESEIIPAPDGMESPSSPPSISIIISPTSSPAGLEYLVNFVSFIVSIGAFLGSPRRVSLQVHSFAHTIPLFS
ncbi:hypothetical protein MKX01_002062 [Papaver californicum]|nr:hypothetical protein MKX01_002062 [Papaver californicum]